MPLPYTVPARTSERIEILKKLPPDQLGDPPAAVYAALLFDDGNQLETAKQYIAIARAGRIFPQKSNCSKRSPRAGGARPRRSRTMGRCLNRLLHLTNRHREPRGTGSQPVSSGGHLACRL